MSLKSILLLAAVAMAWSAAAHAQPTDLVTTHGRNFAYQGETFRFVGVNIRGLAHYGQPAPLQYTTAAHITENLDGVAAFGGKVIRLFAANKHQTNANNIAHLEAVLDQMETRGLKAIVCFTDIYTTDFHPPGDDSYYMLQPGGYTLLDDTWFNTGYTVNYKPWVVATVTALKDHNAVFAWELGNELTDIKVPNRILTFTADMASTIKAIDPHHMVTTGYISIEHTQVGIANGLVMYADPNIDFITFHTYNGDDSQLTWTVFARLEKPMVLEEYGWDANLGNRITNTTSLMAKYFDERLVSGFMHWGYQWQNYDIGDGDAIFGFDRNFFGYDYNDMANLYQSRATQFINEAVPLPSLAGPTGNNVAPDATAWQTDSNFSGSYDGSKAIDGVLSASSKWTSNGNAPPHWLAVDLGSGKPLTGYIVRMACAAGEDVRYGFKTFQVQTGDSLTGPWTTRFTVSNPAQIADIKLVEAAPHTARFVRLYITNTGIDNYARLPEFEIYAGGPSAVESWSLY